MNQDSLNNTGDNVSNKDVYEISESSVMNQANNNIYNLLINKYMKTWFDFDTQR